MRNPGIPGKPLRRNRSFGHPRRSGDETSVVRIHSGNGPHQEMDRRAIACFVQALQDVGLPGAL
jgi:hypothetical protein